MRDGLRGLSLGLNRVETTQRASVGWFFLGRMLPIDLFSGIERPYRDDRRDVTCRVGRQTFHEIKLSGHLAQAHGFSKTVISIASSK